MFKVKVNKAIKNNNIVKNLQWSFVNWAYEQDAYFALSLISKI